MKKKNRSNTPKRKRLNRVGRLAAAGNWMAGYQGKNLVKSYRKWFGVDVLCAVAELEMLGVRIDPDYKKQLQQSEDARRKALAEKRALRNTTAYQEFEMDEPWHDYSPCFQANTDGIDIDPL